MSTLSDSLPGFPLSSLRRRLGDSLPRFFGACTATFRVLETLCLPWLDLAVRWWLAQHVFVSGLLKVTHWETALYLARHEYPVGWLDPVTAAWLGAGIELCAPVLLVAGFATRYAALALCGLTVIIQFQYLATDAQLFSIALLTWYMLEGAGPFSFDHALRHGLAESALPLIPRLIALSTALRTHAAALLGIGYRAWLATALLSLAPGATRGLPIATFDALPAPVALVFAGALVSGSGTRCVAAVLATWIMGQAMMTEAADATFAAVALFLLLALRGAGPWSVDRLVVRALRRLADPTSRAPGAFEDLPRVVIIGGGFGGLACAARLRRARVAVTLIDRNNYHLFQPLLYQVATAAVSPGDIAVPLRSLFRDAFNTRVLLGAVEGVDTARREVCLGARRIPYDYLVLATGATHSYFGAQGWAVHAPGLKRIEDATDIRRRLLTAFELAEASDDPQERAALLTFLIVGGGPTGVELAGAVAELARHGMAREFRRIDPASARILLIQSGARLLPAFEAGLAARATAALERLGVEVVTGARVEAIDAAGALVGGQRLAARTVIWAAGVTASPAATWLGVAADASGRVPVGADLAVPGFPGVFAIGDTAASQAWDGKPVPGLAPAAKQGGVYVADVIRARVENREPPAPFRYRHAGNLATIGRKAAVADFGRFKLWGAPAWWLWGLIHLGFLVGVRNRLATLINWFWSYLTFSGGIRLITAGEARATDSVAH